MAMAMASTTSRLLLLAAAVALMTILQQAPAVSAWRRPVRVKVYVQEYLGDGPATTEKLLVRGPGPEVPPPILWPPNNHFGDTLVMDDLVTETADNYSAPVGRVYGTYMVSSMTRPVQVVYFTLLLTTGPYNGSTIVMGGIDDASSVLEHAVIGGTGALRGAQGYVVGKVVKVYSPTHVVMELDVYATVPVPWTTTEAEAATSTSHLINDH